MCSRSPVNGPQRSLVTHTCEPLELSYCLGSQQIGLDISLMSALASVDLSGMWAALTTPLKLPGLIQCSGVLGTQVPSLSAMVTSSLGPTPMPLGARKPVA